MKTLRGSWIIQNGGKSEERGILQRVLQATIGVKAEDRIKMKD